jgi:cytochrome c oxidase subunit 2
MPLWADRVEHRPPPAESTQVRVVAEQFAWNVHYPGPDGQFGRTDVELIDLQANPLGLDRNDPAAKDDVTTINQLHLPADRPALLTLSSKDVIHSFALQEMRIKQDVIPGMAIPVWFVPKVTTEEMRARTGNPEFNYEIACAQLCGLGHYRMRGFVTIHRPESFQKWMDERQAELAESDEDAVWN